MIACIINALLFSASLWKYYKTYKSFDHTFIVMALYASVAITGIGYFTLIYDIPKPVTITPFIYLFVTASILFRPLIKTRNLNNKLHALIDSRALNYLIIIFVICAFINLYNIWTDVLANIISGDWQSVKVDAYMQNGNGVGFIAAYTGAFAKYFCYLIYPYCFYSYTKKQNKMWRTTFILLLAVTSSLFQYLMTAYRGGIFSIIVLLLINFVIFQKNIPLQRKKKLYVVGGIMMAALLIIAMSITNSRFEDSKTTTPLESLFLYFGQSMVNFNGGIANSATSYMGGKYFFMAKLGLDKTDFWIDSKYNILTNDGSDFDTLIGCFYIDFGPILAFVILSVVSYIMMRLLKFRPNSWATLYALMFYLDMLVAGVFHGPSYMSQIVTNVIVIYILIFIAEKYGRKNSRVLSQG